MSNLVEVRAIVRREMLDRVVRCLKDCSIPRFTVIRVHAVGAAVAAPPAHVDLDEGAYSDMALVQCICAADRSAMVTELVAHAAYTGKSGDGIVSVHPVQQVTKIRTGESGLAALA